MADEDGRARARMIARRIEVGRAAMGAGDYELAELIFREAARRFESTKLARLADEAHAMAVARQQRDPDAAPPPLPSTASVTRKPDPIVARVEPSPKPATQADQATGRETPGRSSSGWPTESSGDTRIPPLPPSAKPKAAGVSKAWLFGGLAVVVVLIAIAWSGLRGSTTSLPQTVAENRVNPPPGTTLPATSTTPPAPTTTTPAPIAVTPPTTTTPVPATTSTVPAPVQNPGSAVSTSQATVSKSQKSVKNPPPPPPRNSATSGGGEQRDPPGSGPGGRTTQPTGTVTVAVNPTAGSTQLSDPDGSKGRDAQRAAAAASARDEHVAGLTSENAGDFPAALRHYERARQLDPTLPDIAQLIARVKKNMKTEATEAIKRAKQYDAVDRVSQAIAEYERAKRNLLDDDPDKKTVNERLDALRAQSR